MPWHIAKSDSCPASKPWAVIKNQDGSISGCHPSKGKAQDHMAALYASESKGEPRMSDESAVNGGDDRDVSGNTAAGEVRFAVAPITHVDVRDTSASHGFWTMSGYAAVFNQNTTLYDGKLMRVTESIDPQAFRSVLRDQDMTSPNGVVHFNLGHDLNRSVAATDVPAGQPGSLQLRADDQGLFFLAKVPHDDPDGVAMAAKMRSGVLRQASFAFTVAKDSVDYREADDGPDTEHRTILDVKRLYDVCATPQGAYSTTTVGLRSYAAALGEPEGHPLTRQPHVGDETDASPDEPGDGTESVNKVDPKRLEEIRRNLARKTERRAGFPHRKAATNGRTEPGSGHDGA